MLDRGKGADGAPLGNSIMPGGAPPSAAGFFVAAVDDRIYCDMVRHDYQPIPKECGPMSIRKRKWTTAKGVEKEAWIVDYPDGKGVRRMKTFARKKDADAFAATARIEVREGTHVADGATADRVMRPADLWIAECRESRDSNARQWTRYRQRLADLHIVPFIGHEKLSRLTRPGGHPGIRGSAFAAKDAARHLSA